MTPVSRGYGGLCVITRGYGCGFVEEINRECPTPAPTGTDTTPDGIADALACRPDLPWEHKKRDLW